MNRTLQSAGREESEKFLSNLIAFDSSLPHISNRLSPITFTDYFSRHGIVCMNLSEMYGTANEYWNKWNEVSPGVLDKVQGKYNLNQLFNENHGGWCTLIEALMKVEKANELSDHPYYQMHYLSHVMYDTSEKLSKETDGSFKLTIFFDCIAPILYERIVQPTHRIFSPVLNYTDIRFREAVTITTAQAHLYIETHSSSSFNLEETDKRFLASIKSLVEKMLSELSNNNGKTSTTNTLTHYLNCIGLINTDISVHELSPVFTEDTMTCTKSLRWLNKMRKRNESNLYSDDTSTAIDDLLDVYSILKKSGEKYAKLSTNGKEDASNA